MKTRPKLNNFLVMLVFLLATLCTAAAGETIYVDASAPGPTHDGTSWANAYKYLQDALTGASSGDEIRVAEGVYKPDQGATVTPGDREATFHLKNGVAIYGGIVGGASILSGDIGTAGDSSDNSYHVVTGSGTDETAIIDGFTITAGNANGVYYTRGQGGGMYNYEGSPTVSNCTFTDNSARYNGGGMCNWNNSRPTVSNCTFRGNSAEEQSGGGMCNGHWYYGQCSPTVTNCTFSGNSATYGAGMCNWNNSSPTLINCTFSGNSADHSGGGMCNWEYSSPILADCPFTDNSARYLGGGMCNWEYSNPTLTDCTFSENSANNGGGMYNGHYTRCSPTLTNCEFTGNSATRGGGISNEYGSSPTLTDCKFTGNLADKGGGMINFGGSPTLNDCTFSENSARVGGGMHNSGSSLALTNCTFSGNIAMSHGGGMFNNGSESPDSEPTLTDCTFSGNVADIGGGMYNVGGTGGIFGSYDTPDPTLTNCTFRENSATMGGGMYNIFYSSPKVANCTFSGNAANIGGGMCNNEGSGHASSPTVTNCTFSGNIADASGGGIASGRGCFPTVTNCILWDNTAPTGAQISYYYVTTEVTYSDVQGGTGQPWFGTGCIDTDPLFMDADLRLSPGSPCIDAGDNTAVPAGVTTDLDGNPRIVNGIVDMGAYESEEQGPSIITVEIDIKPGSYPSSINLRSKGVTPVAIHTTPDFDATTVDPTTVLLNYLVAPLMWEIYDCDEFENPDYGLPGEPDMIGDGDDDLVLYFDTQELVATGAVEVGDEWAILTGETTDGTPIEGMGDVNIVVKGEP